MAFLFKLQFAGLLLLCGVSLGGVELHCDAVATPDGAAKDYGYSNYDSDILSIRHKVPPNRTLRCYYYVLSNRHNQPVDFAVEQIRVKRVGE